MTQTPVQPSPQPPVAKKVPAPRTHHGDVFVDNYEWLRDKESAEVVEHLKAENAYQEAVTAHQEPLREAIFQEIKGRTQETDLSVPEPQGRLVVLHPFGGGQGIRHPVPRPGRRTPATRWRTGLPRPSRSASTIPGEEVLLDGNVEAEGKPFFAVGGAAVTVDGNLYAYAVDNAGDERFTLRIKDLRTGELLPDVIENVFYGVSFSPDGSRIFYTVVDDVLAPLPGEVPRAGHARQRGRGDLPGGRRRHVARLRALRGPAPPGPEHRLLRVQRDPAAALRRARRRAQHRDLPRRAHPLRGRAVPADRSTGTPRRSC